MSRIEFCVQGKVIGKGRPRFASRGGKPVAYTPEATRAYEAAIRVAYVAAGGGCLGDGPIWLRVRAEIAVPKHTPLATRALMLGGRIRPTKKPDADNILKIVADALNGSAYRDDKQIVMAQASKHYAIGNRLLVEVGTLDDA